MLTLITACLLQSPSWVKELAMTPPPVATPQVKGPADAPELVVVSSSRKTMVSVDGPGRLRVRAAALLKKKGAQYSAPGKLLIWIGSVQRRTLALSGEPAPGWAVVGRPQWALGELVDLEAVLAGGRQKVSISHQQGGAGSYALFVSLLPPAQEEIAAAEPAVTAPPPPPPPLPVRTAGDDEDDVPPLVEAPIEVPPPPLATEPQATPGLVLPEGPRQRIDGPDGSAEFYTATIESSFTFAATGPGQVLLDVHALRHAAHPETEAPIIFGVLLDDILVQTVALDQPTDARWQWQASDDQLSARAVIRLPLPVGAHRVALSLSDNATRGAAIRPRFLAAGVVEEPEVLDLGTARRDDLRPADDLAAQLSVRVAGGLWLPHAIQTTGATAQLGLGWGLPVLGSRLWLELQGSFGRAAVRRPVAVDDLSAGRSELRLTVNSAPILALATWSAPMPLDGLTLEVTLGGGLLLAWNETHFASTRTTSGLLVVPTFATGGGLSVDFGPGAVLVRAELLVGLPWTHAGYREFESGAVAVNVGYRLALN